MIETINIEDKAGTRYDDVPVIHLAVNPDQQFVCLGIDFDLYGGYENFQYPREGVVDTYMGKLDNLGWFQYKRILNSLEVYEWDFEVHPNPEVILITTTENIPQE